MNKYFVPAVNLLNRLSYPRKFGLIGLLLALPLGLVTFFLVREINRSIAFSAKEHLGTEYLRHVQQFAADLRDHRGLIWADLVQRSTVDELKQVEVRLKRDIESIDAVDAALGELLQTTPRWAAIKDKWSSMDGIRETASPVDPENHHTDLIGDLLSLMSQVGDQSNLILDPDLDSYYLMDLTVNHLPLLTEQIGQARGLNSRLAGEKSVISLDQFQSQRLARAIELGRERLKHHFDVAFRETSDTALSTLLGPSLQRSLDDTDVFLGLISKLPDTNIATPASPDLVWQQGTSTLEGYQELYSLTVKALDQRVQARIAVLKQRRFMVMSVTVPCMLLTLYLFAGFYMAVKRTIDQLDEATQRLVGGQSDDFKINVDTQDELGQVTRSFGALAARLRTECISLKNSQRRLNAILDGATDAIVAIDEQGNIESVNSSTERLFGHTPGELLGKNVKMLMPDPYQSGHDGYLRNYLATGQRNVIGIGREVVGLRRDGSTFHIDLSVSEVKLDDRRIFTGFVRDISDRKLAVQELATANAKFARVLDASTQISIISTDVDGLITVFNTGAQNLLGYSAAELIGIETPRVFHVLEEVVARGEELSREFGYPVEGFEVFVAYARQGRFDRREWTYVRKDGGRFTVSLVVTAVNDATGKIVGFLGVAEDITLRKETERHLQAARDSAEQVARAKGEFLANMSHEIRTPMNGIIGMTDLVLDTSLTAEQQEYLEIVKSSGNSLLRIINDILDFSKIEAGKLELDPHPFRLRDLLGDTMKTLAIRAHEKELELLWQTTSNVPDGLIGDAGRLRQILVNLVGNAIKFTEAGEVSVLVELVSRSDAMVQLRFSVRDTGIGIPKDKVTQIFDAFSQADASTTRAYGGTGLGLSISRQLVLLMGGDLTMESEEGKGSTFRFEIELSLSNLVSHASELETPIDLTGVRVLVVDDNQTNRRILLEILRGWKMRPTLADCGQTALEEMHRAVSNGMPFDLVLTDCHMPHMDGFMFVSELKKHPNLARSTIMMLTSADRQGAYERCQQLGIEATLLKPLKQSELLQAVCEVFRRVNRRESRPVPAQPTSSAMNTRRLRVLLAEDNEVNQRVAIRMLNKLGHEVVVVGNGQLAIDALQAGEFDVVLMDVQMPVLDGFQTVAAIRNQEKLTGKHQPVFAMTAHAMSGDRQRCLDAGMDDYLSKPISETSLSATLSGVAGEKPVVDCVTTPDSAASLQESFSGTPLFDLETAVRKVDGDRDFLNELMGIFLKMIPDVMKTLNQHAEQRDLHATGESAHLIKGTIANFCAHQAFAAALRLEQVCRDGKIDDLENAHRDLSYEVDRLSRYFMAVDLRRSQFG